EPLDPKEGHEGRDRRVLVIQVRRSIITVLVGGVEDLKPPYAKKRVALMSIIFNVQQSVHLGTRWCTITDNVGYSSLHNQTIVADAVITICPGIIRIRRLHELFKVLGSDVATLGYGPGHLNDIFLGPDGVILGKPFDTREFLIVAVRVLCARVI